MLVEIYNMHFSKSSKTGRKRWQHKKLWLFVKKSKETTYINFVLGLNDYSISSTSNYINVFILLPKVGLIILFALKQLNRGEVCVAYSSCQLCSLDWCLRKIGPFITRKVCNLFQEPAPFQFQTGLRRRKWTVEIRIPDQAVVVYSDSHCM